MNTLRELRNEREGYKVEARTLLDKAAAEKRNMSEQEVAKFEELSGKIDALHEDIKRREKIGGYEEDAQPKAGRKEAPQDPEIGMNAKDLKKYSITRAIAAAAANDWSGAGLEKEASDAVAKKVGRDARSFFVPFDVLSGGRERRDMTVGTSTAGGYLVATNQPATIIELLTNKLILGQAGAQMLNGLVGDLAIPKQTGGATGYWVAEGNAPTEGAQTLGQVALTPHTFGAYVDISRKLLKQSSISVEQFVRNDIARTIALGLDYAGLHGDSGSDANQPDGVAVTSGIGSVVGGTNGAAPDWADIVDLETEVGQDNADLGSLAYITNAKVRGKLKKTMRTATYGDIPIWDPATGGGLNGYPALVSNQVRSNLTKGSSNVASAIFFGNWADLVIGMWGEMDMLVDPYSLSTSGAVRVVAFQDVDFGVRHAQSFAAMLDALTA
jgi:HK97 family phage major capsid protein